MMLTLGPLYPISALISCVAISCGSLCAIPQYCQRKKRAFGVVVGLHSPHQTDSELRRVLFFDKNDRVVNRFWQLICRDRYTHEPRITDISSTEWNRVAPERVFMID